MSKSKRVIGVLFLFAALLFSAAALAFGGVRGQVSAEAPLPSENTFSMIDGASVRFGENEADSGLRFMARVPSAEEEGTVYKMLIVPADMLTDHGITDDFVAKLKTAFPDQAAEFDTYFFNVTCTPFTTAEYGRMISAAMVGVSADLYGVDFTGVAYTVDGQGEYRYAEIDLAASTRSIHYVAKAAADADASLRDKLYPYLPKYTVSFADKDGATANVQQVTAVYGDTVEEPYSGRYVYDGWYKDAACTQPWDFASDVVADNVTLYTAKVTDRAQPLYLYDFANEGIADGDVVCLDEAASFGGYFAGSAAIQGISASKDRSRILVYFKEPIARADIASLNVAFRFQTATNYAQICMLLSDKTAAEPLIGAMGANLPVSGWGSFSGARTVSFNTDAHFTAAGKVQDKVYGVYVDVRSQNTDPCRWMMHSVSYTVSGVKVFDFAKESIDAANVEIADQTVKRWTWDQEKAAIAVDTLSADVGANANKICLYFDKPVPRAEINVLSVQLEYVTQCNFHYAALILSPKGAETLELGGTGKGLPTGGWEGVQSGSKKNVSFDSAVHFTTTAQVVSDYVYGICFDVRGTDAANGTYLIHNLSYTLPSAV